MTITIHRGTHQIGGCVTELRTKSKRIFIDFGKELPTENGVQPPETLEIDGLNISESNCDGVFFTHTHGDHVGNMGAILPDVPLYMGEDAQKICISLHEYLQTAYGFNPNVFEDQTPMLNALQRAKPFVMEKPIDLEDITVTPLRVDHSAFDAYMFLVEAEGVCVLHTGDFRDHGYTGDQLLPVLEKYAGKVDWLVCEGTMLSRDTEEVLTEQALAVKAKEMIGTHKNVFVLCSSTHIDRIQAFYNARPSGSSMLCDGYQYRILQTVNKSSLAKSFGYNFSYTYPMDEKSKLQNYKRKKDGFLMLVRATEKFMDIIDQYPEIRVVIYSMWKGYLQGKTANPKLVQFCNRFHPMYLHTSGHATEATIQKVYEILRPKGGVIPIHSESPQRFREILPQANIVTLEDGESFDLCPSCDP